MTTSDPLPTLRGESLRLRRMVADDARWVLACWGDPEVMRYMARPPLAGVEEARRFIEEIARGASEGRLLQWGIVLDDDPGGIAGTVTLVLTDPRHETADLGFAVARGRWGARVASRAVRPALAHAFETLGLYRVQADVDPRNPASIRVLERLGFVREGMQRGRYLQMGERQDAVLFGLLAPDWHASRPR